MPKNKPIEISTYLSTEVIEQKSTLSAAKKSCLTETLRLYHELEEPLKQKRNRTIGFHAHE